MSENRIDEVLDSWNSMCCAGRVAAAAEKKVE
jgi:hypothetical protein